MATPVLYRKWRPQTLAEVVGQEAVTRTLSNAVVSNRVAHAYLFTGPRGTGKTSTARILAKAVNCLDPQSGDACDRCSSCRSITEGASLDVIEIDAASNRSIDDVRDLREKITYMHGAGRFKVYIIDEVHMWQQAAANALLKTLEEPPPHAILILATTEPHQLLPTILSRCQRFDFRRIPHRALVGRLAYVCQQEQVTVEPAGLDLIARTSGGGLRDALNVLEQLTVYYGQDITLTQVQDVLGLTGDPRALELVGAVVRGDLTAGLTLIARVGNDGIDLRQFTREVVEYLRALLLIKAEASQAIDLPAADFAALDAIAGQAHLDSLTRSARLFSGVDFRQEHRGSLALELALLDTLLADQPAPSVRTAPLTESRRVPSPHPSPSPRHGESPSETGRTDVVRPPESVQAMPSTPSAAREKATASSPAAPPFSAGAEPEPPIETIRRQIKGITMDNKLVQALLRTYVSIESVDDSTIALGFRHSANKEKMQEPKNREAAEAAISRTLGGRWRIQYVEVNEPQPVGHLVRKAQELGFRVVEKASVEDSPGREEA